MVFHLSLSHSKGACAPIEGGDKGAGNAGALQCGQPLAHARLRLAQSVEALRIHRRHAPGQPLSAAPFPSPLQNLAQAPRSSHSPVLNTTLRWDEG